MRRALGPPVVFLIILLSQQAISDDELSEIEVTLAPPLPICEVYQACSAETSVYPKVTATEESKIEDFDEPTVESFISSTANLLELGAGEEEFMVVQPGYISPPDDITFIEGSGDENNIIESSGEEPPVLQFIVSSTQEPESTVFPLYDEFVNSPNVFDFEAKPNTTRSRLCRCATDDEQGEDPCSYSNATNVIQIDESIKLAFCAPPLHHSRCIGRRNLIRIIGEIHDSGESIKNVLDTAVFCDCPNGFRRVGIEPWENNYAFKYQCL